jgi:transposase
VRLLKALPVGGRLLALDETPLRHLPPLRAAWALRGKQAEVPIRGKNARRSLFGTVDLRTGRRVLMASGRQGLSDFHRFLRRLRHGVGARGALWLLLDRHGSHRHPSSVRLAHQLNVRLLWLPRQHPKLNPVDHLWRGLKNDLAANRQFASIDEQVRYAEAWVRALTPTQTLRKAGLLAKNCWLKEVRKTLWPPT